MAAPSLRESHPPAAAGALKVSSADSSNLGLIQCQEPLSGRARPRIGVLEPKVSSSQVSGGRQSTGQLNFPRQAPLLTHAGSGCGCPAPLGLSQGTATPHGHGLSQGADGPPASHGADGDGTSRARLVQRCSFSLPSAAARTRSCLPPGWGWYNPSTEPALAAPAVQGAPLQHPQASREPEADPPLPKELYQRGTKQRKIQARIPSAAAQSFGCKEQLAPREGSGRSRVPLPG